MYGFVKPVQFTSFQWPSNWGPPFHKTPLPITAQFSAWLPEGCLFSHLLYTKGVLSTHTHCPSLSASLSPIQTEAVDSKNVDLTNSFSSADLIVTMRAESPSQLDLAMGQVFLAVAKNIL